MMYDINLNEKKVILKKENNMSRIKRVVFTLAASFGLFAPAALPTLVSAQGANTPTTPQIQNQVSKGTCLSATNANCTDGTSEISSLIASIINIFSLVVGVVAVVMIIIGGFRYITSGGDSGNVSGAKNTILYALIGLVIVALSQIIVRFVLTSAT